MTMSASMFGPAGGGTERELAKATIILEEPNGTGNMFEFTGGGDATALISVEQESEPDGDGRVGWTLRLTRVERVEPEQEPPAGDGPASAGHLPGIEALKATGISAADVRAPRLS